MTAPKDINRLIERFQENRDVYCSSGYNEAQARIEFIDFGVGGVRKFFVEAKRPGLNIKEDSDAAHQLRRYAWSAKLPLPIVTDFEEFAVYDFRIKPAKRDTGLRGQEDAS